jgi:hypothetical protein
VFKEIDKQINSRQRIKKALNHMQTDRLPVDFGGSLVTDINLKTIYKLRQYYGLDKPGTPVKLIEPFWGVGETGDDLRKILGSDVKKLESIKTSMLGIEKSNWKEWELDDGTPVLVPGLFNTEKNPDGSLYQYPQGDKSAEPSSIMPKNGYYFDAIIRQEPVDYNNLNPKDNMEEFQVISDEEVRKLKEKAEDIFNNSEFAILLDPCFSSFGDISGIPGVRLKNPKGIRDISEWYMITYTDKNYIKTVFNYQCEVALENYAKIFDAIGNKINVARVSAADFGTQDGQFYSVETYRDLYKPFAKKVNDWIHSHTQWKTFIHSCGSVYPLIPEFIDAGFDILNPVQVSALNMEPERLKKEFGRDITFWGGAVDPQKTLPFGTPREVREAVRRNIEVFFEDGGYVFANVHVLQANVPIENIVTMIEVINEYRK